MNVINCLRPLIPSVVRKHEQARPCPQKMRYRVGPKRRTCRGGAELIAVVRSSHTTQGCSQPSDVSFLSPEVTGRPYADSQPASAIMLLDVDEATQHQAASIYQGSTSYPLFHGAVHHHHDRGCISLYERLESAARSRSASRRRPSSSTVRETLFKCSCQRSLSGSEHSNASTRPQSSVGLYGAPGTSRPGTSHSLISSCHSNSRPASRSSSGARSRPVSSGGLHVSQMYNKSVVTRTDAPKHSRLHSSHRHLGSCSSLENERTEWRSCTSEGISGRVRPLTSFGMRSPSKLQEGERRSRRQRPSTSLGVNVSPQRGVLTQRRRIDEGEMSAVRSHVERIEIQDHKYYDVNHDSSMDSCADTISPSRSPNRCVWSDDHVLFIENLH